MLKTFLIWAVVAVVFTSSQVCADECDAVLAGLSATIAGLEVGERIRPTGNIDTITLKHVAADEIKLTCNHHGARSNKIELRWHSPYPPPDYFDLLAAAGAIVTASPSDLVRKGALTCLTQALLADTENMQVDLAGVHSYCYVSTMEGRRVLITVSSMRDERDLREKMPDPKNLNRSGP